ncbi:MAG: hypothetical protein ACKO04_03720 [Actinomycetes bacterium]
MDGETAPRSRRWLVRLVVLALGVAAVAGLRQVAVTKADQEFEEQLRRRDTNRE